MDRTSREEWAKRVERWGDSGLTAKEYAGRSGGDHAFGAAVSDLTPRGPSA
jgi:hypothetical protein